MLVLSQFAEERYAIDLVGDDAAGVGYLLKDRVADFAAFAEAVRRVAAGGVALDPTVVSRMLGRRRRDDPLAELTPREREVLELMAEGRSNPGIAEALVVTPHAVEKHVTAIFSKLDLRDARERPPAGAGRARLPPPLSAAAAARARRVPAAGRAVDLERPSSAPTRSSSPRSPLPPSRSAPPAPSSLTSTTSVARPARRTSTRRVLAPAYLATLVSASATTK